MVHIFIFLLTLSATYAVKKLLCQFLQTSDQQSDGWSKYLKQALEVYTKLAVNGLNWFGWISVYSKG